MNQTSLVREEGGEENSQREGTEFPAQKSMSLILCTDEVFRVGYAVLILQKVILW